MKMYRNVLFAVAGMTLLFAAACSGGSPFTADVTTLANAAVPVISVQPAAATDWNVGVDAVKTLTVTASVTDGGTLSYQWYTSAGGSVADGNAINGQTSAALTLNKTAYGANGDYYFYVVVTNTNDNATGTKTAGVTSSVAKVTVTGNGNVETEYTIVIDISGEENGDTVTVSPNTGKAGDTITLAYTVADTKLHNLLDFGGVTVEIASVDGAENGTRTYAINAADASNGVITITAIFNHTDLELDPIEFNDTAGHITKTYGEAAFTNAVKSGYKGSGAITYSSSNTTIATVDSSGQVTILKAGSTIITAEKAADATYAHAQTNYTLTVNSIIEMVSIPAGTFMMGSPTTEADRNSNERQHSVTLTSGFFMGTYQVTQEQYQAVMGTNPSNFTSAVAGESGTPGKLPVEKVTWYDTVEFCNKLSVLEGLQEVYTISGRTPASGYPINDATVTADFTKNGYRLPTEAEWEYACRAGTTTAYNTGDAISDNTGWYYINSGNKTHQVGLKPANAWGLYDMHGNVEEWCWDWYDSYSSSPANDPTGASSGSSRVMRGGSWYNFGQDLRSACRLDDDPSNRGINLGFRLVRQ